MKIFLSIFSLLCCLSFAQAQNINITLNSDLNLNCKFEKVILKNPDHNFESFTKDQIKRNLFFFFFLFYIGCDFVNKFTRFSSIDCRLRIIPIFIECLN